jgi:hypothetical protein
MNDGWDITLDHLRRSKPDIAPVRSSELVGCGLTKAEVNHILSLISTNEREGWYYGIAAQYWVRSDRIKEKLQAPNIH